jgi:hypothetical protein
LHETPTALPHDHVMAATVLESGTVDPADTLVHAVRRRLTGAAALCGAGAIEKMLAGRFDPEATEACPECAQACSTADN